MVPFTDIKATMRMFEDDDAGYLTWIERNQHDFVVNTTCKPDPRYLYLHRATCGTIRGKPARGDRWTTGDFIKACSENRVALDQWARQTVGGEFHTCGLCRPDLSNDSHRRTTERTCTRDLN